MLRTTVIAKTDLVRSTEHLHHLTTPELDSLLTAQRRLFEPVIAAHEGTILKGEGDSFWLTFPSVTAAALAAIDMHRALRHAQLNKPDQERLSTRVIITIGDALHRDDDIFGTVMALTARIEGVTPANEIYMSHGAWAILNHAQVETEFVDTFTLKGFDQPERVYRVVQHELLVTERNQFVVASDLGHFTRFVYEHSAIEVANVLARYEDLAIENLAPLGGKVRVLAGDMFFVTFDLATDALAGIELWAKSWITFVKALDFELPMRIGMTQGPYYLYRTHMFGHTINKAAILSEVGAKVAPEANVVVILAQEVNDALNGTDLAERLQAIVVPGLRHDLPKATNEQTVFRFMLSNVS